MKKVLYLSNIPSPYRVDFFNQLSNHFDLTVVFEAQSANQHGITFDWNYQNNTKFRCIFLSEGDIEEKKVNCSVFQYIEKRKYDSYLNKRMVIVLSNTARADIIDAV